MITSALLAGLGARPAAASTLVQAMGQAGEIKHYGTTNCLTKSNSSLALSPCSGTFGQQLWTVEPDNTIRIWGYGSISSGNWTPASEKCLNVPASNPTSVEIDACGQLTTSGTNPVQTDTWQVNDQGTGYATISNIWQAKCLTTAFAIATCNASSASQQWVLPAADSLHQAASAALGLQSMYDSSTGLFADALNSDCPLKSNQWFKSGTNSLQNVYGGNCWWWSANALYALIDFLEQAAVTGTWSGAGDVKADIAATYRVICSAGTAHCPVTDASQDPSPWLGNISSNLNHFQNNYFDDTGNWALAWLNAYQYTKNANYLYLAENLWHFITNNSWGYVPSGTPSSCGTGGLVQFRHWNEQYPTYPAKNLGTNALYLRLSAWLYTTTGQNIYFDGVSDGNGAYDGGLQLEAKWLLNSSGLVQLYPNDAGQTVPIDQPNSRYMLDGEVDPNSTPQPCAIATNHAKETQHEGMVLAGLASTHDAVVAANAAPAKPNSLSQMETAAQYLTMADNLAQTAVNDSAGGGNYTSPPMIDTHQVLSETCTSDTTWPDGCDLDPNEAPDGDGAEQIDPAWLPGKGIFLRGFYCATNALQAAGSQDSSGLAAFISSNAAQVWTNDQNAGQFADNLDQFGFLWDYDLYHANWSETGQGYATEGAALEALSANAGLAVSSPAMC